MSTRVFTKCMQKQFCTKVYHLNNYHTYTLTNRNFETKWRPPLLTHENNFTNVLNKILVEDGIVDPYTEIEQQLENYTSKRSNINENIRNFFNINYNAANKLLKRNSAFQNISAVTMKNNFNHMKNAGMSVHIIQDNINLLTEDTTVLQKKIKIIQDITNDLDSGICFFNHRLYSLELFNRSFMRHMNNDVIRNEINYLKSQMENQHLYKLMSKHLYCFTYYPEKIISSIKLFLNYNINADTIVKYKWNFCSGNINLESRLQKCGQVKCLSIKPWMLTCSDKVFEKKFNNSEFIRKLDEQHQVIQYLSDQSGYSKEMIKMKMQRRVFPNLTDLIERVKVILKEGYDYDDIIFYIQILNISTDVLHTRFTALQAANIKTPPLNILLLSEKKFNNYKNASKLKAYI